MSWWNAVSTCWPPGEAGCVVWWDAWAAGGALIAAGIAFLALAVAWLSTGVTAASAIAVWRLGAEANRLARAPSEAFQEEARRERTVLLSAIYGELLDVASTADAWTELMIDFGIEHMLDNDESRQNAANSLKEIDMPMAKSLIGRLHVLPAAESSALAQCLGIVSLLHMSVSAMAASSRGSERAVEVMSRLIFETDRLKESASGMAAACEKEIYPITER